MHWMPWALSLPLLSAGSSRAARMAMMAITTSSSISVKPRGRGPQSFDGAYGIHNAWHLVVGNYSPVVREVQTEPGNGKVCVRLMMWRVNGGWCRLSRKRTPFGERGPGEAGWSGFPAWRLGWDKAGGWSWKLETSLKRA